jgi:hypothetical protein
MTEGLCCPCSRPTSRGGPLGIAFCRHGRPRQAERAHRPRRRPGPGRDRRQRSRHPRAGRRPRPGAVLHHQAGRQGHRPGAGHLLAHPSSSATTATCASPPPRATPASRCCCRSPRAGNARPPVLSWHATVSTVPGSKGRADRPARKQEDSSMTEVSVSFASNFTDEAELDQIGGGARLPGPTPRLSRCFPHSRHSRYQPPSSARGAAISNRPELAASPPLVAARRDSGPDLKPCTPGGRVRGWSYCAGVMLLFNRNKLSGS